MDSIVVHYQEIALKGKNRPWFLGRLVRIKQARGWAVDLDEAELTIHVELLTSEAFYFFGKERGAGGLPTGTAGRVTCLLSGGIDSPVAAHRMMKRGCAVSFVHFHSYPILSRASMEKARELVSL